MSDGRSCWDDANVSERALTLARSGDEDAFRELTEPYRRELQLHCYRIVGSTQDAEDLVQETLLAAWRGLEGFTESASLRTWLYRIATNRSLDALRANARRPQRLEPLTDPPTPSRLSEPIWLEPYPDALIEGIADEAPGPEARYDQKEALALAFVAGLQHLQPQQRILETSPAAVNSLLVRARQALDGRRPAAWRDRAPVPNSPHEREVVGRFADALEDGDVGAVVALLTDDAWLTMPPYPYEYQGAAAIENFLRVRGARHDEPLRLVATRANGQPAFGCYFPCPGTEIARAYGLLVLTLAGTRIAEITFFADSGVFPHFGLPRAVPKHRG
jgi:RNA polymerase sigma-70 factor, ECF subfamily